MFMLAFCGGLKIKWYFEFFKFAYERKKSLHKKNITMIQNVFIAFIIEHVYSKRHIVANQQ